MNEEHKKVIERTADTVRDFTSESTGVLYTMVNMTRKTVGVATSFEEVHGDDGSTLRFAGRCPNAGLREKKLVGQECIAPGSITSVSVSGDMMQFTQLRGSKADKFVVLKSRGKYINTIL